MAWQPFSLHFRQILDGGYRYLDKTGEFMLVAENEFNFIPGDTKVTGAKLEKPEDSISITVDSQEIIIRQDFPADAGATFLETVQTIAKLVDTFFQPVAVRSNGFAYHAYWPITTADKALAASVQIGGTFHLGIGERIGMVPIENEVNCLFQSGSKELRVHVHPVSIESAVVQRRAPGLRDSKKQKARIDRMNKKAERLPGDLQQGMMLALDLQQKEPPPDDLEDHFKELFALQSTLEEIITIK